jgi:HlyD family secretion protein
MKAAAVRVVKKSLVRTVEQPGQIAPLETTPLVAKVAGYVQEVKKDIGDKVDEGETLVLLRSPELLEEVKQKEAQCRQSESAIAQARAGVRVAEAYVAKAESLRAELQAGVARAKADVERWKAEASRIRDLVEKGAVTESRRTEMQSQVAAAAAALDEAKAKLGSVDATVAAAKAEVDKAAADLQASESQRSVATAARDAARQMTDYLVIRSPFTGHVTARNIDTGHFVSSAGAEAKPLLVVVRTDRLRVFVDVPEYDAQFVDPGDKATVRVQALGDKTFAEGVTVTRTAMNLDQKSGTLRTEIDLDNAKGELRPGLYANVTIELSRREGVLTLPTSALFAKDGKTFCVVVAGGKASLREVKKGLSAGAETEITDGVREGELVVAKNSSTIADGQTLEGVETPTAK